MSAKRRVTTNINDKEYSALSELAERYEVSLAWLGRRAFTELIEKYRHLGQMPLPFSQEQKAEKKR